MQKIKRKRYLSRKKTDEVFEEIYKKITGATPNRFQDPGQDWTAQIKSAKPCPPYSQLMDAIRF